MTWHRCFPSWLLSLLSLSRSCLMIYKTKLLGIRFSKSLNSKFKMSDLLTNIFILSSYFLDYYYRIYPKGDEENLHDYDYIPIRVQSGALGPHLENPPQHNHVQSKPRWRPDPGTDRHQLHRLEHLNQRRLQQRSRTVDQPIQIVMTISDYGTPRGWRWEIPTDRRGRLCSSTMTTTVTMTRKHIPWLKTFQRNLMGRLSTECRSMSCLRRSKMNFLPCRFAKDQTYIQL